MKRWVAWSASSAVMVSGKLGCILLKLDKLPRFEWFGGAFFF